MVLSGRQCHLHAAHACPHALFWPITSFRSPGSRAGFSQERGSPANELQSSSTGAQLKRPVPSCPLLRSKSFPRLASTQAALLLLNSSQHSGAVAVGVSPPSIEAVKPRLAANNVFLMAARGSPSGEQAAYLAASLATLPQPTRVLLEVHPLPMA